MKNNILLSVFMLCFMVSCDKSDNRQVISLNGEWQVAKTDGSIPETFPSIVNIPGLVDLARPALDTMGTLYPEGWYWHKRQFDLENIDFDKIELKVFKAKYHTKVYINGKFAGENFYCFTPSYFDIKPFILPPGQTNEIIIGIGCKSQLPDNIPDGNDFEKLKYIPGVYDNVEITLTGKPFIRNIQCVPDIKNEKLRVIAEIETDAAGNSLSLTYNVTEVSSQISIASQKINPVITKENGFVKADFEIDMKNAKLWSPESPFLYELKLNTASDNKTVRFGMRSFRFDPDKKIALLNEKPYYLRGTNICIFRFFEDPDRGALPWDSQWAEMLHERFKDMHWNSMRYCIGFPPERWYEICDSLGFMLQDEFPIWGINITKPTVKADGIAEEYERWMRERWNHPSVVIWDAQNETVSPEIGIAIETVRGLDLSNRPWENGWSRPMANTDPSESHPYLYSRYTGNSKEPETGYKKDFFSIIRRPDNDALTHLPKVDKEAGVTFDNPSIINEYGWIWLNRDGSTTTLTDNVYKTLWDGQNLSPQQRLEIYARRLAELTEYWRAHRRAAGVLHFCGLAYSRSEEPRGQTSDHWIDIKNLTFEPEFYKYVKHAFSPVGLMIDSWEKSYNAGEKYQVPVFVINDLDETFTQKIEVSIIKDEKTVSTVTKDVSIKPYEVLTVPFEISIPDEAGVYLLKAETAFKGNNVFSMRDLQVKK